MKCDICDNPISVLGSEVISYALFYRIGIEKICKVCYSKISVNSIFRIANAFSLYITMKNTVSREIEYRRCKKNSSFFTGRKKFYAPLYEMKYCMCCGKEFPHIEYPMFSILVPLSNDDKGYKKIVNYGICYSCKSNTNILNEFSGRRDIVFRMISHKLLRIKITKIVEQSWSKE